MKVNLLLNGIVMFALALPAFSQGGPPPHGEFGGFGGPGGHFGPRGSHKLVLNAPYTANMSNSVVQHLADGTTITRTTDGQVARDSQGRTYEQFTTTGGPLGQNGPKTITFISDPVAGYSYMLDATNKTAVQRPLPPAHEGNMAQEARLQQRPNVTETDLAADSSSGVTATGKSITHTIPAGADGNDKAITTTTQTWTAPDLQIVVKSIRNDPFSGVSTYQLSNVVTKEPEASLFAVPSGYKVVTESERGGPGGHPAGMPPARPY